MNLERVFSIQSASSFMSNFHTRRATPSDYQSISNLSRRSVGSSDYVLSILKRTIRAGGLFIALDGRRVIGMANYQLIADGSGWLSMARTDPDYRGKRVAGLLQESIAHYARGEGVNFLRMLINSSNTPSINSARRGGFKPVTEVAHVTCPLRSLMREEGKLGHSPKGEGGCARLSKLSGIETVQISKSRYLWKMNGFFGQGWHVVKWNASSRRDVAKMIESSGEAFRCDGSTMFMLGRPPEEEGGSHGEFAILTGVFGEAIASVKDVAASSLHLQSIGTFLPFDPYLLRRARAEHGFHLDSWANHGFIFEKRITGR